MKRIEVDDDIKDLLERTVRATNTAAKLQSTVSEREAKSFSPSEVLRLALRGQLELAHERIEELAIARYGSDEVKS